MRTKEYKVALREQGMILLRALAITAAIMFLFYRSFGAAIVFPMVWLFEKKNSQKRTIEKNQRKLRNEFLHGIEVLNGALQAGFSMENAWKEVEKETRNLYGEDSGFYCEIKEMNQKIAHNMPIESLFLTLSYRCQLEEMIQFAELLQFGKRSGSNWKQLIDITVYQMKERQEALDQIEIMVAEKKMEQKVMNVLPLGLLIFLQFSSWDYMSVLYHNWFGVIAMSLFLIGYVAAIMLSQRILKVKL